MSTHETRIVGRLQIAGTLVFRNSQTGDEKRVQMAGTVPLVQQQTPAQQTQQEASK